MGQGRLAVVFELAVRWRWRRARRSAPEAADRTGRQLLLGASGEWVERRQAALAAHRVRALELLAEAASAQPAA